MTRLAVFDCDGTLVDGQADVCWAMERAFTRAGLTPPDNHDVRRIVGLSLPAAVRSLARSLHAELGGTGVRAGTVTVAGTIRPGTSFDPAAIAEAFWAMHEDRAGPAEVVFTGASQELAAPA